LNAFGEVYVYKGQDPASPQNLSTAAKGPSAFKSTTDNLDELADLTWVTRLNDAMSAANNTKAIADARAAFIFIYTREI
jgi:hypothetical protein